MSEDEPYWTKYSATLSLMRRVARPLSLLLILFGVLVLAFPEGVVKLFPGPATNRTMALLLLTYGAVLQLFDYLQGRFRPSRDYYGGSADREYELQRMRERLAFPSVPPYGAMEDVREELRELRRSVERGAGAVALPDSDKTQIVAALREAVGKTLTAEFLGAVDERYSAQALRRSAVAALFEDFGSLRRRLMDEVATLQRRANANLSIGGGTTLLARIPTH